MNKTINQYSNPMTIYQTINAQELYCLYCNKPSIQLPKPKVFADYISSWTQVCSYDCNNCIGVHYVIEHNYKSKHDYSEHDYISTDNVKDNIFQQMVIGEHDGLTPDNTTVKVTDIMINIQNDIQIIIPTQGDFDTRIRTKTGKLITSLDPSMTLLLLQYPLDHLKKKIARLIAFM